MLDPWTNKPSDWAEEVRRQRELLDPPPLYEALLDKIGYFLGFILIASLASLLLGMLALAKGAIQFNKKILALVALLISFIVILATTGIIASHGIVKILLIGIILSAYALGISKYVKILREMQETEQMEKAFLATNLKDSLGYIPRILKRR